MALTQVTGSLIAVNTTITTPTISSPTITAPVLSGTTTGTYTLGGTPTISSPTITSPTISGTPVMSASVLTSGTANATTSGTSIDFTGIPNWVKRITVMFNGVSTNGTSSLLLRIGSGSVVATGYAAQCWATNGQGVVTSGFPILIPAASSIINGLAVLCHYGGNVWTYSSLLGISDSTNNGFQGAGYTSSALAGALDRIRLTTVNGTDTFDAGSINIQYE
jgi:hypothetical protein